MVREASWTYHPEDLLPGAHIEWNGEAWMPASEGPSEAQFDPERLSPMIGTGPATIGGRVGATLVAFAAAVLVGCVLALVVALTVAAVRVLV